MHHFYLKTLNIQESLAGEIKNLQGFLKTFSLLSLNNIFKVPTVIENIKISGNL